MNTILSAEARKQVTEALQWVWHTLPSLSPAHALLERAIALLASLPEAKPSAQGLMLLVKARERAYLAWKNGRDGDPGDALFDLYHATKQELRAYVESLEASRIAPEGQAAHSKSEYKRRVAQGDENVLPPAQAEMTDAEIDRLLGTRIPGGSEARDWFLPHDTERGLANVRGVVRAILRARKDGGHDVPENATQRYPWRIATQALLTHWKTNGPDVSAQWCSDAARLLGFALEGMKESDRV